jgi:hypothetical protein
MANVGRVQLRSTLYSYLTGAGISGLNQVFTSFPKRINYQVNATAGQMSRAAAVIFIASERETRLAIGGATNGWKRVDFQVVLQIFHHSLQNNAEDAMSDFDTLIDNIKNTLRASHNFGDSTQVNVWQGAEPVINCLYGEPTTSDNGATETFAEIQFDVTQMIQA